MDLLLIALLVASVPVAVRFAGRAWDDWRFKREMEIHYDLPYNQAVVKFIDNFARFSEKLNEASQELGRAWVKGRNDV